MPGVVADYVRRKSLFPAGAQEQVVDTYATGDLRLLPWTANMTDETSAMRDDYARMFRSPVVKSALLQKVFSVAALDLTLAPASTAARDVQIAEMCKYVYTTALGAPDYDDALGVDILPSCGGLVKLAIEVLLPALVHKVSICEPCWHHQLWERGKWRGKRFLRDVKAKDNAELKIDDFGNVVGVQVSGVKETLSTKGFVIWRNLPIYGGPGESDLRAAHGYWKRLESILTTWMIHLDRFVSPVIKVKYPTTYTEAEIANLSKKIALIKARGYVATGDDVIIEALQLATRGEGEMQAAVQYYEERIALSIMGAYLQMMTSGQAGAGGDIRGDSETQRSTSELFIWYLTRGLESVMNHQITPMLVDVNFDGKPDVPTASLGGVNYADTASALANMEAAQRMGAKVSRKAVQALGVPLAETPDDELVAPMAGLPIAGQPGSGAPRLPFTFAQSSAGDKNDAASRVDATSHGGEHGGPVSVGGADGERAAELLDNAIRQGQPVLESVVRSAVERLLARSPGEIKSADALLDDGELNTLQQQIINTLVAGDLLGRARIRIRQQRAEQLQGALHMSSEPTGFHQFAEAAQPIAPLPPLEAIDYFQSLVPGLAPDVQAILPGVARRAFTLAVTADRVVLDKVKTVIGEALASGSTLGEGTARINDILDAAGVSPRNPQYAEAVFRTNTMEAYRAGAQREFNDPDVADTFPAWMYTNARLNTSRPEHAARDGKVYDRSLTFAEVRGTKADDVINCTCDAIPVDKWELAAMQARGVQVIGAAK